MKYIVAVSGGVGSVVLLDMLVKQGNHTLVVAHFDHGIRPDSDADARFVKAVAESYSLPFETVRKELGQHASEEVAREHRYAFLRDVAQKHEAEIITAHHYDDVLETIAINITRGTGWRGLAVMNSEIVRPLLAMTKNEIYEYALANHLEWVEDETNQSKQYLRNRLREEVKHNVAPADKVRLMRLWQHQKELKSKINAELDSLLAEQTVYSRYFFTNIDDTTAAELLWAILLRHGASLTRPQRSRVLHAIKTMKPGAVLEAGSGVRIEFSLREFVVKTE